MSAFPTIPDPPPVTEADRRWLGAIAASALRAHFELAGCSPPGGPETGPLAAKSSLASLRSGIFVTHSVGGELRGCLGSVSGSETLLEALPRLAVAAATRDSRFPPLSACDLETLEIEITLLGELVRLPPDPLTLLEGLKPAEHGVQVRSPPRSGLLLPQVARRYGWSALELLEQTCQKARLDPGAWRLPSTEVLAFRSTTLEFGPPEIRSPGGGKG